MFQSFTGNSRRARQVNLSGQNNDPFAATAWGPAPTGTQRTVAAAQQERLQRQQERARLTSAKTIQRIWRGHRTRRELADSRRQVWDDLENRISKEPRSAAVLPDELRLLLSFFNARREEDIQRLALFGGRVLHAGFFSKDDVYPCLLRLAEICLAAMNGVVQSDRQETVLPSLEAILRLLMKIWSAHPKISITYSRSYYKNLSRIVTSTTYFFEGRGLFLDAVHCPLIQNIDEDLDHLSNAYRALGIELLTTPALTTLFGPSELRNIEDLGRIIDTEMLSMALLPALISEPMAVPQSTQRLWLLAHFLALCRVRRPGSTIGNRDDFNSLQLHNPNHIRLLSVLLSSLGDELYQRIDAQGKNVLKAAKENDDLDDGDHQPPLATFIADEIANLARKENIANLCSKFHSVDISSPAGREDIALLASFALNLMRMFRTGGDDIRMWLHAPSFSVDEPDHQFPATKFFWNAVRETSLFRAICKSTDSALAILKSLKSHRSSKISTVQYSVTGQEWQIIILFLELYSFGMRFTDDEEFLAGGSTTDASQPMSRFGKSAIPLTDVKSLSIFLKNLAFTMIFYANDINSDQDLSTDGSLGNYLAAISPTGPAYSHFARGARLDEKTEVNQQANDIAGMPYSTVRELVISVLRMLYERDSRRRFLPNDHWLMTSKFDMGSFIPAVVQEEERQHEVDETDNPEELDEDDDRPENQIIGIQRPSRAAQIENLRRQQVKAARKRILAAIGPRLEILQNMPFVIPFSTRVQIFSQFVLLDQTRRRGGYVDPDQWRMSVMMNAPGPREHARELITKHHAKIRRGNIFEDAMDQFYGLGQGLKEPIQITFVDKFDSVEAGIDGGGVTKEFLTSITTEAFRTTDGPNLFVTNDQNLLYPNPSAVDERKSILSDAGIEVGSSLWNETINGILRQYEFLGRIVGKCLYEGILVDISFAGFFLLKWSLTGNANNYRANINDLRDLDEDLYRGLLKLKNFPGNVEDFGLDFTIEDVNSSPGEPLRTITRDLLPNGSKMPVTRENRISYISLVTRHRLQMQPLHQTNAFLRGLGSIIKPTWLSMFNQSELQTLIGGDSSQLDIDDLRRNTQYGGVYLIGDDGLEHPSVQYFWQVMKELNDTDRRKVLKYVTSTPRAPLLGFGELNPNFSIRDAGSDETRLPSTSTCVNLLKLPIYSTKQLLKDKLLYAVNAGAGFDLS